ncbi:hypothetical protein FEM48_Zijuj12G0170700 [Ziziphus jujuba var. spinosa]|uniref:Uncharacterized protein n=1 Tax=Ziziphus jujuba var. spinosa TaxID=714518 RepID=A0A978UEK3_ZIZJJ|nr:hypothetical protein FEM48_Zijuj12G0170700 [Ziziphus jujuba var. spinosa]
MVFVVEVKLTGRIEMGFIVVVSLPLILFILILVLAFYLLGRSQGRREASVPQYYGPPAPPVQAHPPQDKAPSQV